MPDDAGALDLATIGEAIEWTDYAAATAVRERLAAPDGRYGRLADLAEWLASTQGAAPPHDLHRPRVVCFGAPAADSGVGALLGVGRRDVPVEPAAQLDRPRADEAIAAGARLADAEVDEGTDLFVVAVSGSDIRATAIVAVLTDTEPSKVLSRGADAVDPEAWMQRAVEVRDLRRRGYPHRLEPAELVAAIGSAELATAAGFVLEAAARRMPVLLDGLAAVAAALLAYEAKPRAVRWWRLADRTPVPAHELAATTMALEPVLDLGLRLADGTAGALAVTVLRAAVRMVLTDSAAVGSASTGDESADGSADNGSADNADQDATGDVPADRGER